MLQVKNITKVYETGNFTQKALDGVSIKFRENEFVSILGPSGSGKTTLLNIIGGLDQYSTGDLIINGKSTTKYRARDWDAYRNNSVGFVFQSYNLILHQSVLANVEMALKLTGVKNEERKRKAKEVLEKVGLIDHINKKPTQLSGGQMQRVAIARALINDPDILLADEPTGALDSKTSVQIMDLLKEIAKDKLVIMVTHNPELANQYSNRIIKIADGKVVDDSNPLKRENQNEDTNKIKRTHMPYLTALSLSLNNLFTKKGRTILTAFASSIGIIGIALILALSDGFKIEIDNFEKDSLSQAPITISSQAMQMDADTMAKYSEKSAKLEKYPSGKNVFVQEDALQTMLHKNNITEEYVKYLKGLDKQYISGIAYDRGTNLLVVNKDYEGKYNMVNPVNMGMSPWTLLPANPNPDEDGIIENMYDVLAGEIKEDEPGLILQVDSKNQIYASVLKALGIKEDETVSFEDILNRELKVILNDDYFQKMGASFVPNQDLKSLYNNKNSISIKVQAIIRGKKGNELITSGNGFAYTNALTELVVSKNKDSEIVKVQKKKDYNILTNSPFDETSTKENILAYLGSDTVPMVVYIYPKDFKTKEEITKYLDKYNDDKEEKDIIQYSDMASMISSLTGNIMDAITVVLIAFSSISLVVSSIMIGIITYISVLERTKEIGILRALGARSRDIKRVFNAETFIIGFVSGIIGLGIAYLLTIPTNIIIEDLSGLGGVAKLNLTHAIILLVISIGLTVVGGSIPAKMASRKDPVEALRTE